MIPFDVFVLAPSRAGFGTNQAQEDLRSLASQLAAGGRKAADVLSLTYFVDAADLAAYGVQRFRIQALVRDFFGPSFPPATVVAQRPGEGCHVVLEAGVLSSQESDVTVERRVCDGVAYSVVEGSGMRQVHCGGIASDPLLDDPEAQAVEVFAKMRAVLQREQMTFGHVVRQWGYIEGLLDVLDDCPKGHQRYQAFNDVRTAAYARSEFPAGYPAATGIGQATGGVVLEFIALDAPLHVDVAPLSNPRQTDAHRYSGEMLVGESLARLENKSTPKFERAKIVTRDDEETVFVSGTAAIVGERSVALGDLEAQSRTTIDNIAALVGDTRLSRLRAYVKRSEDIAAVRAICEDAYGSIPAVYVQADVCRDELLVELEGALCSRAYTTAAGALRSPMGTEE